MWKKILIFFLLFILLLFVLVIGSAYFFLGTERGFSWTTERLQNLDERLTVGEATGDLNQGIGTDTVSWEDEKLTVNAEGIHSKWSSTCLLRTAFCLERLNINELEIITKPTGQTKPSTPGKIELPNVVLPLHFDADEITIDKLTFRNALSDAEPLVIENITLAAEATGSDITIQSLSLKHKNYTAVLDGEISLEGDYPIDARIQASAADVVDDHDFQLFANLSNTVANLRIDSRIAGAAELKANADIQVLEPSIPLRANLSWDNLGWPLDTQLDLTSNDGRVKVVGDLNDYVVRTTTSVYGKNVPPTDATISGRVNTQRVLLPQIDLFLLDGVATGSVAANWDAGVNWVGDMVFKNINPGRRWNLMGGKLDGLVQLKGSADNGSWGLNVERADISGELRNYPFDLSARVTKTRSNEWHIPELRLENGPNRLDLAGSAGDALALEMDLDFPAIQTLIPSIAGNLKGKAVVSGKADKPSIELDASSSLIKVGEALFRELKLDANVAEAATADSQVKVSIGTLNVAKQEITKITSTLNGTRLDHTLGLSLNGPQETAVDLTTTGTLPDTPGKSVPSGDWSGVLQKVRLTVPKHSLNLAFPTKLAWRNTRKELELDPHCWLEEAAKLCLKDPIKGHESGEARVTLEGYRLAKINSMLPAGTKLEGELGANSNLAWNLKKQDDSAVELNANVTNGAVVVSTTNPETGAKEPMRFAYNKLTLKSVADPYTVVSDIELASQRMGNAKINFTLNPKNEDKPILGKVSISDLQVGLAKPFLANFDEVDGRVSLKGDIAGTLTQPLFDGRLSVDNPVFKSDELPLGIDGGQLTADIKDNKADLGGKLESGEGSFTIGGNAKWGSSASGVPWQALITIDGKDLSIVQNPLIYSEINPALRIKLDPNNVSVSGDIDIPAAEIDIKERTTGAAALSGDVVIIEDEPSAEEKARKEQERSGGPAIQTNLNIKLGDDVNLSGYGLNAQLTGDIAFKKINDDPEQLGGEIRIVKGFYKSYGQDLEIKDGQILFVGPVEQTTLNIDAVRSIESEDRVAGINVEGPIADPQTTLFTDPPDKTQESILSYIVLGRDLGTGQTTEESSLLAQAALALTLRQGRGLATGLAESIGIQDFQIDASGSGDDTQVVVSGRLSSKLLLRYGRSVFAPQETLYLRYDISKRLYLEAAQGVERAVDLFYSISF